VPTSPSSSPSPAITWSSASPPTKPFITSPSATSTAPSRLLRSVLTSLPRPLSLCLPGPHPALIGLLRHGYRIEDWDLAMATTDLTLPTHWVYSPSLG